MGFLGHWYLLSLYCFLGFYLFVTFGGTIADIFVVKGDAQIGLNVTPVDAATVASEVWYGKETGKYSEKRRGVSVVYSQLYPFEGLWNYTSGIIHHVRIDGKSSINIVLGWWCVYFFDIKRLV